MRENVGKRLLLEFLDFLRYKVDNDLMTMEDIESLARVIEEHPLSSVLPTTLHGSMARANRMYVL